MDDIYLVSLLCVPLFLYNGHYWSLLANFNILGKVLMRFFFINELCVGLGGNPSFLAILSDKIGGCTLLLCSNY